MTKLLNAAQKAWVTRRKNSTTNKTYDTAFDLLSPAGKRIAIAKDVLKLIKARQLKPHKGLWVDLASYVQKKDVGASLQELFSDEKITTDQPCEACALGACFVSAARLGNKAVLSEIEHDYGFDLGGPNGGTQPEDSMWRVLSKYFSDKQIALMEIAFEEGSGWHSLCDSKLSEAAFHHAADYGLASEIDHSDAGRLTAMMENIIKNNGTFIP